MTDHAWFEELSTAECLDLLRDGTVGRIAVVIDGNPLILPVNYRLAEPPGRTWIAIRTRPYGLIEHGSLSVAFEIDGVDAPHHEGWSVLVRGTLHAVNPDVAEFRERFDPEPWVTAERDSWVVIEPFAVSGRRLHAAEREWAFQVDAYL